MFPSHSSKKIAFKIPFNLPMTIGYTIIKRSNEWIMDNNWIKNRLNIFMSYTLKSLKNQTNQDFVAYILYHTPSEAMILNELKNYPKLPNHIQFIRAEDYDSLIKPYINTSEFYYEVELGSDDMYHKSFVQYLYSYNPKPTTRILICQNGYIFSSKKNILSEYFNFSSFFNCWIYKSKDYINNVRYSYKGYTGAIKLPHEIIPWRTYINHSHQTNIAFSYEQETKTPWGKDLAYIGTTFTDAAQKQTILNDFLGQTTQNKAPATTPPKQPIQTKVIPNPPSNQTVQDKIAIVKIKFNIPFNVYGNRFKEERLTQQWIDYRLDIFMKYTYTSLINQTNQNFIALIHYDPITETKIRTSLSRYPALPNNIRFVPDMEAAIKDIVQNYNYFLLVHLDSDNMFHPYMMDKLLALDASTIRYVCCQSGFILDLTTHKLAFYHHYLPDTFYTLIYPTKEYLAGYRISTPGDAYNNTSSFANPSHFTKPIPKNAFIIFPESLFIIVIHEKTMTHSLDCMFAYQTAKSLISNPNDQKKILTSFKLPNRLSL